MRVRGRRTPSPWCQHENDFARLSCLIDWKRLLSERGRDGEREIQRNRVERRSEVWECRLRLSHANVCLTICLEYLSWFWKCEKCEKTGVLWQWSADQYVFWVDASVVGGLCAAVQRPRNPSWTQPPTWRPDLPDWLHTRVKVPFGGFLMKISALACVRTHVAYISCLLCQAALITWCKNLNLFLWGYNHVIQVLERS